MSVTVGQFQFLKEAWHSLVDHSHAVTTGCLSQCAPKPGFADAAGTSDDQITLVGDPSAREQALEQRFVEATACAVINIFWAGANMAQPGSTGVCQTSCRFGLPSASGNTYLAMWRDLVKRYPDLDARRILKDLMESHGSQGKWFAAAKTAKYLDIALDCAAQPDAAPATLIRAARDFVIKEPPLRHRSASTQSRICWRAAVMSRTPSILMKPSGMSWQQARGSGRGTECFTNSTGWLQILLPTGSCQRS